EGGAGAGVLPRLLERDLRGAEHLQPDERAREVEALHHLGEPGAASSEAVPGRDPGAVEVHRPAAHGPGAEVREGAALDAVPVQLDEEGGDAAAAALRGGTGEDDGGGGMH